jgi:hypothetical protein
MADPPFDPSAPPGIRPESAETAEGAVIRYPETFGALAAHLSFLIGDEVRNPRAFNAMVPTVLRQLIDFFEIVHRMHDRAAAILAEQRPYCLYLRRFTAGGQQLGTASPFSRQLGLVPTDQHMQGYLRAHLDDLIPVVGCFNTFDLFGVATAGREKDLPAALRLLSHNWQRTVQVLIDGAHCVVLFLTPTLQGHQTEGVQFELGSIRQFEQHRRCIFVLDTSRDDVRTGGFDVHAAFGWPAGAQDWDSFRDARDFVACLRALASDGHRRTRRHPAEPAPPCYVVDKDLTGAQVLDGLRQQFDYPYIVPDTLQGNLDAVRHLYPRAIAHWQQIETQRAERQRLRTEDLAEVMYEALGSFVAATTLEHYEPMARSLALVGLAHRMITRETDVEQVCLEGAVAFARYAGLEDLAQHFAAGLARLPRAE